MRIEQIIVTGISSTGFSSAVNEATRVFKIEPKPVNLHVANYLTFTIGMNPFAFEHADKCIDFCNYLLANCPKVSFVWLELVLDETNRKGKIEDRIIYSSNNELDD